MVGSGEEGGLGALVQRLLDLGEGLGVLLVERWHAGRLNPRAALGALVEPGSRPVRGADAAFGDLPHCDEALAA